MQLLSEWGGGGGTSPKTKWLWHFHTWSFWSKIAVWGTNLGHNMFFWTEHVFKVCYRGRVYHPLEKVKCSPVPPGSATAIQLWIMAIIVTYLPVLSSWSCLSSSSLNLSASSCIWTITSCSFTSRNSSFRMFWKLFTILLWKVYGKKGEIKGKEQEGGGGLNTDT